MNQIRVTKEEWRILQDYKLEAPYRLMRRMSEALILLHEGVPIDAVGRIVERSVPTVKDWCRAWNESRLASIHTGHAGNLNASKLTVSQREEVRRVLSNPPSDESIPAAFWSVPDLANWMYRRFGIQYASNSSYHFYMHDAGLSFHRPEPQDERRADPDVVGRRMKEIEKQVACLLEDEDVLVVSADEVRLEHEAIIRRAWHTRGEKTVLAVDRRRQAQSYIGFLHERDGRVDLNPLDWQNTETITDALVNLTLKYPDKKIVIVWDNAGWHRSKLLRQNLGEGNLLESIHLINLPPYSPDHNPIEHVWGEAKNSISNVQRASFDQTTAAFENYIRSATFPYRILDGAPQNPSMNEED